MTPTVITDQERHRRVVEEDSKRKRDLAGFQRVEAERQREQMAEWGAVHRSTASTWLQAVVALAASVPPSTYQLWLGWLLPIGAKDTTLFLAAPEEIRTWTERRYSGLIREALVAAGSTYTDVAFVGEGASCQ